MIDDKVCVNQHIIGGVLYNEKSTLENFLD